jgi:DNA invertase Pin-like site-specific DNA recombinase
MLRSNQRRIAEIALSMINVHIQAAAVGSVLLDGDHFVLALGGADLGHLRPPFLSLFDVQKIVDLELNVNYILFRRMELMMTQKPAETLPLPPPGPDAHKIGYARVSTGDQNPQLQIDALIRAGVKEADIWNERASGTAVKRPVLNALIKDLRRGGVVIVWKMDRLGRNAIHLHEVAQEIQRKGAHLRFLDNSGLDTSTAAGRMMFGMLAHMAQFERDLIYERTIAGLAVARAAGRIGGTKPKFTHEEILNALQKHSGNLSQAAQSLRYKGKDGEMRSMSVPGFKRALERAHEAAIKQAREGEINNEPA